MAVLAKGTDFTTGQQASADAFDQLVDLATFASGAVDNSTTQLSGGAIIVKDGGITSAKLDTNIAVAGTLSAGGLVTFANVTSIGNTTPGSGAFTSLSATSSFSFSASSNSLALQGTDGIIYRSGGAGTNPGFHRFRYFDTDVAVISSTGLAVTGAITVSGALTLGTDLAVTEGGTGASTAADARTNLGLVIGTNVQAFDADLTALAALSGTNTIYYRSGAATWTAVTIGSGISFSGGTLSSTVSGIGGSTGATGNRILRADGTGGSTVKSSAITIDDSGNVTGAATYDAGTGGYKVSGTKVIGAQSAAEADITLLTAIGGSDTVDATDIATNFADLNTKINSILAKLRTHGLIAT